MHCARCFSAGMQMLRVQGTGLLLADSRERGLHLSRRGNDNAMWSVDDTGGRFTSMAGTELSAAPSTPQGDANSESREPSCQLRTTAGCWLIVDAARAALRAECSQSDDASVIEVIFGPTRLPSAHLAELRETGLTVLPSFGPRTLAAMKDAIHTSFFEAVTDLSVGTDRPGRALQLHIPKARRSDSRANKEGIQVLHDGAVVQGSAPTSVTIPFVSITDVTSDTTVDDGGGGAAACVRIQQQQQQQQQQQHTRSSREWVFGLPDAAAAERLRDQLLGLLIAGETPDPNSYRGEHWSRKDWWEGPSGHLFASMHVHPIQLWILEEHFGAAKKRLVPVPVSESSSSCLPRACLGKALGSVAHMRGTQNIARRMLVGVFFPLPAGTAAVRSTHTPNAMILMPQDGSLGPGQDWHSDTPYGSGDRFMDWQYGRWPDPARPLGAD